MHAWSSVACRDGKIQDRISTWKFCAMQQRRRMEPSFGRRDADANANPVAGVIAHARVVQLAAIAVLDVVCGHVPLSADSFDLAAVSLNRVAGGRLPRIVSHDGPHRSASGGCRSAAIALADRAADHAADYCAEHSGAGAVVRSLHGHLLVVAFLV